MKSKCGCYLSACAATARAESNTNEAAFGVTKKREKKMAESEGSLGNLGGLRAAAGELPIEDCWCKRLLKPSARWELH